MVAENRTNRLAAVLLGQQPLNESVPNHMLLLQPVMSSRYLIES